VLPLNRLGSAGDYLVAWDGHEPVGHAFLAPPGSALRVPGAPELQDVWVTESRRREGIASAITRVAEREAAARGHDRLVIGHSIDNEGARRLYEHLGYTDAGAEPQRVQGTITLRGGRRLDVDDTIVYLAKQLT
jgi:GNAT superfamily N-acetyltransferase